MSNDPFWQRVTEQLTELRTAKSADDVGRILAHERNPYLLIEPGREPSGDGIGFFGGSGGDETVWEALNEAGWAIVWMEADYYFCMKAPDGSLITYVEGDIYLGNTR